jgi:hypothetical protein
MLGLEVHLAGQSSRVRPGVTTMSC